MKINAVVLAQLLYDMDTENIHNVTEKGTVITVRSDFKASTITINTETGEIVYSYNGKETGRDNLFE